MTCNHKADYTLSHIGTDIHEPALSFSATFILVSSCIDVAASTTAGCGTPVEEVESEAAEPAGNQERAVKRSKSREWAPLLACERGAKGANQAQRAKQAMQAWKGEASNASWARGS